MAQPIIYLDKSMLINFSMDFILLYLTARLSGYRVSTLRLVLGALVGSIYVLAILLPDIAFMYNMLVKIAYSCLIVAVCFYPLRPKKFLVAAGYFYAISFALGGAIYGFSSLSIGIEGSGNYEVLSNLVQSTGNIVDIFVWGFPLGIIFWLGFGKWGYSSLKSTLVQAVYRFAISVYFNDLEVKIDGLVDTGNQLRDPLTKVPVVVVEAVLLAEYLPKEFITAVADLDFVTLEACLQGTHWEGRLRFIPFSSIGKHNGMMIGFLPDKLEINTPSGKVGTQRVIIGLYLKELSPDRSYRALLHPDLLTAVG
jgi:stage II sporulation protein GA (sporulation sigma-E factor processing peptidase)